MNTLLGVYPALSCTYTYLTLIACTGNGTPPSSDSMTSIDFQPYASRRRASNSDSNRPTRLANVSMPGAFSEKLCILIHADTSSPKSPHPVFAGPPRIMMGKIPRLRIMNGKHRRPSPNGLQTVKFNEPHRPGDWDTTQPCVNDL